MILENGRPENTNNRLQKEIKVYDFLDKLCIDYQRVDHDAADTMEVCQEIDKVLGAIKDKLFLIICILLSISCVLSFAGSEMPLIILLAVIFLWIIYSGSKNNIADPDNLKLLKTIVDKMG